MQPPCLFHTLDGLLSRCCSQAFRSGRSPAFKLSLTVLSHSRNQNKKNGPASSASIAAPKVGDARLLAEEIERVRELIAGRHSKSALQLTKDIYKRCATAESEALLIDAYEARIGGLLRL